jgi:hypothetical protein
MQIVSRDAARQLGRTRFFIGVPCKHGHVSERLVSNRRCVACSDIQTKVWRKSHPETTAEQKRNWVAKNRDKVRAIKKAYYRANEKDRADQAVRSKRWLEANREKSREATAKWRRNNLAKAAAAQQRRRAKKLQRTPVWADHKKILQFYVLARELTEQTGIEHEVDHIHPLQGTVVSGLHVETNLQILPKAENRSKGARVEEWAAIS